MLFFGLSILFLEVEEEKEPNDVILDLLATLALLGTVLIFRLGFHLYLNFFLLLFDL